MATAENTGRQTAYVIGKVTADNTKLNMVCVLCQNEPLPPCYFVMTAPYGDVNTLCERCILISAKLLAEAPGGAS